MEYEDTWGELLPGIEGEDNTWRELAPGEKV